MANITVDNIYAQFDSHPKRLDYKLSCFAPGYKYHHLYRRKLWDGKVKLIKNEKFLAGLTPFVDSLHTLRVNDNRGLGLTNVVMNKTQVPLRDYQWSAIQSCFSNTFQGTWWPRGVLSVATGGGKTEIAVAMTEMTNVPTIFIVHRKDLLYQAHDRFAKYNIKAGIIGDGKFSLGKEVTIATFQTLEQIYRMSHPHRKKLKKGQKKGDLHVPSDDEIASGKMIEKVLAHMKQVFFDEAHLIAADIQKGNSFVTLAGLMPNAFMRWGLTATPFMRDNYSNWLLEGVTGQSLYEVNNRWLIDNGYLAEPNVTMYNMPKDEGVPNCWPDCYDVGVVTHRERNAKVVNAIKQGVGPTLVLVQRIGHGKLLTKLAKDAGLNIKFIDGSTPIKERLKVKKDFAAGKFDAVIANRIWSEGIDIPEIRTLILAGGGKSAVKGLQEMGRGLRLDVGKQTVQVVDFYDRSTRWLREHSRQRANLWKSQGFHIQFS